MLCVCLAQTRRTPLKRTLSVFSIFVLALGVLWFALGSGDSEVFAQSDDEIPDHVQEIIDNFGLLLPP